MTTVLGTELATDLATYIDQTDIKLWPITEGTPPASPGGELVISGPGNQVVSDVRTVVT